MLIFVFREFQGGFREDSGRVQGGRVRLARCLCAISVILNEVKNLVIGAIVTLLSADPSTTLRSAQDDKVMEVSACLSVLSLPSLSSLLSLCSLLSPH